MGYQDRIVILVAANSSCCSRFVRFSQERLLAKKLFVMVPPISWRNLFADGTTDFPMTCGLNSGCSARQAAPRYPQIPQAE
jgi:hypothetical protein